MQALEEDQEGPNIVLKDLFKEDREFNQGLRSPSCMQNSSGLWLPTGCLQLLPRCLTARRSARELHVMYA